MIDINAEVLFDGTEEDFEIYYQRSVARCKMVGFAPPVRRYLREPYDSDVKPLNLKVKHSEEGK